jgi:uncharacterized protein (TIGR02147 family)
MADVFYYTDFRKFLRDRLAQLKAGDKKRYTYRAVAERIGFQSAGYLTQVLQGKSNLSDRLAPRFAEQLALRKREARFFCLMVTYNQAQSHDEKKLAFERMLAFKKGRQNRVAPEAYAFYDKWYYSAIRALLHFYRFDGNYKKLAKAIVPSITPAEARKAVSVLEQLELIRENPDGSYALTNKHITTGLEADAVVINNFVINTLDIARDAFYRIPKDKRRFSSLTVSVSEEGYRAIRERLDVVRRELVEIVDNDRDVDRIYQINVQLFPLTNVDDEGGRQ